MNLEDPYEPCHGLTMLTGPGKIVLYGTFLRNNKHYSPSSKQELRSNAIHEAIHYDNPVLDQFQTETSSDYFGTMYDQNVTGSMSPIIWDDANQANSYIAKNGRAVHSTISEGTTAFSGSFQRFTRVKESSAVLFDTLTQDPFDIAVALGGVAYKAVPTNPNGTPAIPPGFGTQASLSGYAIVCLDQPTPALVLSSSNWLTTTSWNPFYAHAFAHGWKDSFPFESKFAGVSRITSDGLKFGGAASSVYRLAPPKTDPITIAAANGGATTGINVVPGGTGDNAYSLLSRYLPGGGNILSDGTEYPVSSFGQATYIYSPGFDAISITGTANISKLYRTQNVLNWSDYSDNNSERQKMFKMSMYGYGRKNGKILDMVEPLRLNRKQSGQPSLSPSDYADWSRGSGIYAHPAGFKYGLSNCIQTSPAAVYRNDRYGQIRDMLEQRPYTKVYYKGDQNNKRGNSEGAVTCIFVDADGAAISDATKTTCLNLSTAMTSSKPYIEGEVLREIIFSSESVTID